MSMRNDIPRAEVNELVHWMQRPAGEPPPALARVCEAQVALIVSPGTAAEHMVQHFTDSLPGYDRICAAQDLAVAKVIFSGSAPRQGPRLPSPAPRGPAPGALAEGYSSTIRKWLAGDPKVQ